MVRAPEDIETDPRHEGQETSALNRRWGGQEGWPVQVAPPGTQPLERGVEMLVYLPDQKDGQPYQIRVPSHAVSLVRKALSIGINRITKERVGPYKKTDLVPPELIPNPVYDPHAKTHLGNPFFLVTRGDNPISAILDPIIAFNPTQPCGGVGSSAAYYFSVQNGWAGGYACFSEAFAYRRLIEDRVSEGKIGHFKFCWQQSNPNLYALYACSENHLSEIRLLEVTSKQIDEWLGDRFWR